MTADPTFHQQAERIAFDHLQALLRDGGLTVPTARGPMNLESLQRSVKESDAAAEVKRKLVAAGRPDFDLQAKLPLGRRLDVTLHRLAWLGLWRREVGRVCVRVISPIDQLVRDQSPAPLTHLPTPAGESLDVIISTSGFADAARSSVGERQVLLEPNAAGGWKVTAGAAFAAVAQAFDPESAQQKLERVRMAVERNRAELAAGGVRSSRISADTLLPIAEAAALMQKLAARDGALRAATIEGQTVLLPGQGRSDTMFDRMKNLFGRNDPVKQMAALQEQRALLAQQADKLTEDVSALDDRQLEMRRKFAEADEPMRRRITQQVLQLRKDAERRQQMLGVIRQQENVVATHLHHLELKRQGTASNLPTADQLAADATAAEDVLAELQASSDLADSMSASAGGIGMNDAEAALYEELARESTQAAEKQTQPGSAARTQVNRPSAEREQEPPTLEPG